MAMPSGLWSPRDIGMKEGVRLLFGFVEAGCSVINYVCFIFCHVPHQGEGPIVGVARLED